MSTKKDDSRYSKLLSTTPRPAAQEADPEVRRTGIGAAESTPVDRMPESAVKMTGRTRPVTYKLPEEVIELVDQVVRSAAAKGYRVYKQDVVAQAVRAYWGAGNADERETGS